MIQDDDDQDDGPYGQNVGEADVVLDAHDISYQHTCTTDCDDGECFACSIRDCPHRDPLHYHHDGCPSCDTTDIEIIAES